MSAQIFEVLHQGLSRQAPGSARATQRALAAVQQSVQLKVEKALDIGCGPGAQTIGLAKGLPQARIVAVDTHLPFLEQLRSRARQEGLSERITAQCADMRALDFRPNEFDLIWCEGAAYIMGVKAALQAWRPLLKDGGAIGLTELVWTRDDPPEAPRKFWAENYPAMMSVDRCQAQIETCGFRILEAFVLEPEDWWDAYYEPLEARAQALLKEHSDDREARAVLEGTLQEIETYRRFSDDYGYGFWVAQKVG